MKQRFSSLDIRVIAQELSEQLVSLRTVNVYDLSSRIFLFKFARPDNKQHFVVDAGFRCHLTSFSRTTADAPSPFVSRLRKFLRTRRVTSVSQVGTDRILEIRFSEGQYRLYLEFYAAGNIVLIDADLKIIALYRNVNEGADHERLRLGLTYTLSDRQNIQGVPDLDAERVRKGMKTFLERQREAEAAAAENQKKAGAGKTAKPKKTTDLLRKALSSTIHEYPPMLLQHALKVEGINTSLHPEQILEDDTAVNDILGALQEARRIVADIGAQKQVKGYIIAKRKPHGPASNGKIGEDNSDNSGLLYDDYQPFKPEHLDGQDATVEILEFDGFNATVDEFYSSIEGQKLESRLQEKIDTANRKLQHAKDDQAKRLGGLRAVQELHVRKARAIEANLQRVEEAKAAINGLIAQGMDWVDIDQLIALEQKKNNIVAQIIKLPLKLQENTATLLLSEMVDEDEEAENDETANATDSDPSESEPSDSEDGAREKRASKSTISAVAHKEQLGKRLAVEIDLALSGWSNAREYYDQKKTAAAKQEKTAQASGQALRSAQQKIDGELKRALSKEKQVLRPVRNPLWFEKFYYFMSSENYLVVGGKDAQQNETLFKKNLKRGDVFVHADLAGAMPFIIKNDPATPDAPIPPSTLSQAGNLSVCTSSAWDSKAVMSAWWVPAEQVSKISPAGDLMSVGTFAIKGEKSFLPPAQLLLGFAVMFRISDASKANHNKHRLDQAGNRDDSSGAEITATHNLQSTDLSGDVQSDVDEDEDDEDQADDVQDDEEIDGEKSIDQDDDSNKGRGQGEGQHNGHSEQILESQVFRDAKGEDASMEEGHEGDEDQSAYVNPLQSSSQPKADGDDTSDVDNSSNGDDNAQSTTFSPDEDESASTATGRQTAVPGKPESESKQGYQPYVRGKKGKKKKMAQKYADQDPEDREIAMALLGSKLGQQKAEARAEQARKAAEAEERQKQDRKDRRERAQKAGEAAELKRLALLQKNEADPDSIAAEDETEGAGADEHVDLGTLVGKPLPGDEILEAIPVCAPWAALARYKYRAKLQPGTTKKGKAVREILGRWAIDAKNPKYTDARQQDPERIWPREAELVAAWRDAEVFGILPVGKVRVMLGGAGGGKGGGGGGGSKAKAKGGAKSGSKSSSGGGGKKKK